MEGQQEFDKRIARVRQAMRDKGLQTLLVYDSGRHNFLRMNYVAYLTDFISVGPETMLIVPFKEFWSCLPALSGKVGLIGREAMHVDLHDAVVKALKQNPMNAKDIIENM